MKGVADLGWIGPGKMGRPLAERLLNHGYHLTVFDIAEPDGRPTR